MSLVSRLRSTLRAMRGSQRLRREMENEFRDHIARRTADLTRGGMPRDEAVRVARLEFGSVERYVEEGREARGLRVVDELWQDGRYGVRILLHAPLFTAVAVLTLAIGVGGTTAIYSAVRGVLLRPLPYPESERLVVPRTRDALTGEQWSISLVDYDTWRRDGVFEHVAVYSALELNAAGMDAPERLDAVQVSADFFDVLGVQPQLGRTFEEEEHSASIPGQVIISHGLWQRRFGGAADVLERTLTLRGRSYDIIGVLPARMAYPAYGEVWVPFLFPDQLAMSRLADNYVYGAIARLSRGRTLHATRERLAELAQTIERENPVTRANVTITAVPLVSYTVGSNTSRTLWVFLAAVGLVLLIGCVNLANLLLARSATRGRELAIRGSIGASRGRLVRQLFTESLLLGIAGGLVGIAIAWSTTRALVAIAPASTPRLGEIRIDTGVMMFALAISLGATLLFGLVPALRTVRASLTTSLAASDRRVAGSVRGRRARHVLVAAQLALCVVLLAGAGLQLRSLGQLRSTDPGFDTRALLTFSLSLQGDRYFDLTYRRETFQRAIDLLRAVPGVQTAAAASSMPLGAAGLYLGRSFLSEGRPEPPTGTEIEGQWIAVTPGYFSTMRIPLLRGRAFADSDRSGSIPVMIVNREFARRMFPDEDPIGRRVRSWRDENVYREIVGMTDDVRFFAAGDSIRPLVYIPYAQDAWSTMVVAVRTTLPQDRIVPALRAAVRQADSDVPIDDVQLMEQVHVASLAPSRFSAYLLSGFAAVALLLAVVGTYGVFAYGVNQRRREIGIRIALGARSTDVLGMVLREAALVVGAALVAGLLAALVTARGLRALLYETSPTDPTIFGAVPTLLAAVALLASLLPARSATRVDPNETLRSDA